MKKNVVSAAIVFLMVISGYTQNTMYIMKNGIAVKKYNVGTEIDSIIFYQPYSDPTTTVTDTDGNVYSVVAIGTQVWMAENLKTTKFNDGTDIPMVSDYSAWGKLKTPAYCWYDNQPVYGSVYGALYNWSAVNTGKLCPKGWHVPTDEEWDVLIEYLGGEKVAGGKLKEQYLLHWCEPNAEAANEVGFTALPAGYRNVFGDTDDISIGKSLKTWSATEYNGDRAWVRGISYNDGIERSSTLLKGNGFSCRCLKD